MNNSVIFLFADSLLSGGARTRIISELKSLKKNNKNIRLLHLCKIKEYQRFKSLTKLYISRTKFSISVIPKFPNSIPTPFRFLSNILNLLITTFFLIRLNKQKKIDVIHSQGMFPTFYSLIFKKLRDRFLVFDCHGIIPEEEFYEKTIPKLSLKFYFLKQIEYSCLCHSNTVITVSNKMSNHLRKIYKSNYIEIPMCVEKTNKVEPEIRDRLRKILGLEGKKVLVYAGSLTEHQQPKQMVTFFKKLISSDPKFHFLLMVPKNYLNEAKSLMSVFSSSSFTILSVKHSMVPVILSSADIGIMLRAPSLVNLVSSPTKFSEYLASGLPVISTSHVGDSSDVIRKYSVGLILEDDFLSNFDVNDLDKILKCRGKNFFFDLVEKNRLWSSYSNLIINEYNSV